MLMGTTLTTAVRTLQRAADIVSPGESVVILPGIYAGDLRVRRGGEIGRPVVFRAQLPGTVTITEAAPKAALQGLEWQAEGGGVHSTVSPWPVYYLRQGQAAAYHVAWGGLGRLKALTAKHGAWPAFAYEASTQRLFVFLPKGLHPADADLTTHRPIPAPREWGNVRVANVWVEAPYVEFEGLRFDFGVGAGLLLWDSEHVRVRDCVFTGARVGIASLPQVGPAHGLTIEDSLYHHYPQFLWRRDWLDWREVYAHYSDSSLVAYYDAGLVVKNSLVTHAGDALQLSPPKSALPHGALVEGNLLMRGTDDAIELDGPAVDVMFKNNLVYDFHQNLGLSPVLQGPVVIEANRFLHPADGVNGSQMKLMNPWFKSAMDQEQYIRNVDIRGNVFVGNWLLWQDKTPLRDVRVSGNRFAVQRATQPLWPTGVTATDNEIEWLPAAGYGDPAFDVRWWQPKSGGGLQSTSAQPRPGPRWLDWSEHPATRDIAAVLPLAQWTSKPSSR
jgi:hypothetical protein